MRLNDLSFTLLEAAVPLKAFFEIAAQAHPIAAEISPGFLISKYPNFSASIGSLAYPANA
jgi:hypothetical protein